MWAFMVAPLLELANEDHIPRFISELTLSPEAVDGLIKDPQDRGEAVRPLFESLGGNLVDYYFSVGNGTVFVIYDLPDAEALQAVSLRVIAGGVATNFTTHRIITSAEAVAGIKKAGDISYSPPAS